MTWGLVGNQAKVHRYTAILYLAFTLAQSIPSSVSHSFLIHSSAAIERNQKGCVSRSRLLRWGKDREGKGEPWRK